MRVAVGMDVAIGMTVVAGRDRVELDPGGLDRRLLLGPITLGIVARLSTPGLHRRAPARRRGRARYACMDRV
jgi:hypothetical protein